MEDQFTTTSINQQEMEDINEKIIVEFFQRVLDKLCSNGYGKKGRVSVTDFPRNSSYIRDIRTYCLILDDLVIYTTFIPKSCLLASMKTKSKNSFALSNSRKLYYITQILAEAINLYNGSRKVSINNTLFNFGQPVP